MKNFQLLSNGQKYIDILAAILVLSLPFSTALPNLLLIPLVLLIALNYKKTTWIKSIPVLIFLIITLGLTVSSLFENSFLQDFSLYSKHYLVLLLFFVFLQVKNKKQVEYALLLSVSIAVLISSVAVGIHIWHHPDFLLDHGGIVNELLLLERPYFGFLLVLSVFVCLKNAEKSTRKYDYYLLSFFMAAFSIYISARLAMGLICLLFFVFLFKNAQLQRKIKIWLGIMMALLFAISMGLSDNLISRMRVQDDMNQTIRSIKYYEPRFVIWPCAVDIVQDDFNIWTGLKSYDVVEKKLTMCYGETVKDKKKRGYYLYIKYNTHNQFLGFLLLGGIIPCLLLWAMFFSAWFSGYSFELKLLFLLFFAFFLVENVLHRQLGCYLFGIFAALYSRGNFKKVA